MSHLETLESLALRLKQETATDHERMHQLMGQADVFANRDKYALFTLSQYYFQKDVEYLFDNQQVAELITDLDIRGRSKEAAADLQDLGVTIAERELASIGVGFPEALGWIYVSEGSTLGAAFLFKQAQKDLDLTAEFGARNLAAYPEGRAKVWKHFTAELDQANFSQALQDRVIAGAKQGFDRFGELLQEIIDAK
ncbi:biliverdin-producing heme oxygenase [Acinetobacter larvae]|uniref:Biliverdin-producing heme oxygenase n=1 Tax=Acinetobacter larvae TaxID=1789224 RepID=A0A1B2LVR2_9GAMM|nr:biliverdin-producing heme oxygenase [Acinetobacter larvae]AOA57026.1 biliverdin-producing heme oxygenase [Acinetobacter larvae]